LNFAYLLEDGFLFKRFIDNIAYPFAIYLK